MGGQSAADWIVKAINGDDIPEIHRSQYNAQTVFSKGSANICCLQATCAGWFWYHRDQNKARAVLRAWEGYLGLGKWYTSEPWTSHRYGSWINMSYEATLHLARMLGNETVVEGLARYLRFEMLSTILTMGWASQPGFGYSYARGGSRSWCGWDTPSGKGTGDPYKHLIEQAGIGRNVNNWLGKCPEANWELEPILKALKKHGHRRWDYLAGGDKTLCQGLVALRSMNPAGLHDLNTLIARIRDCNVSFHGAVHLIKTDHGTAWISEKTHGAGSTSFMVGKVWYAGQRNPSENQQVWADKYSKHFAPIFEGNKARRADPGGFGSVDHDGTKYVLKAWTGAGDCSNGYLPGPNKHNDGRDNPRDPDGWKAGPQVVTLGGSRVWHVRMDGKKSVKLVYPDGGTAPPPPPPTGRVDMLELMAPSSVHFAKTSSGGGRMSTVRDDENRVFAIVKGRQGMAWDWYYWDDNWIYHVITEDGGWDDPTTFKSHIAPGVIWCRRFATLGESFASSTRYHQWANCSRGPVLSLGDARTTLHGRAYTAGELGLHSDDVPRSTVCYRIDWRWGPNVGQTETFTYASGWGFLDWDLAGFDVKPTNLATLEPLVQPVFNCFDVPKWVDKEMRNDAPPPPPPPDDGPGWHTVEVSRGFLKFDSDTARKAIETIEGGDNHVAITQIALLPGDLAALLSELKKLNL